MKWKSSVHIYGFVDNIELMMRSSDVLITKAGPATITEAAVLGLPIVMNTAIKYQESPNVEFVIRHGAGVYAPGPEKTAECVAHLLETDGALETLSRCARTIAQPDAIWKIADQITASAATAGNGLEKKESIVAQM